MVIALPSHYGLDDMMESIKRRMGWGQKFTPYFRRMSLPIQFETSIFFFNVKCCIKETHSMLKQSCHELK